MQGLRLKMSQHPPPGQRSTEFRKIPNDQLPPSAAKLQKWIHDWKGSTQLYDAQNQQIAEMAGITTNSFSRMWVGSYGQGAARLAEENVRKLAALLAVIGVSLYDILTTFGYPSFPQIAAFMQDQPGPDQPFILAALALAETPSWQQSASRWKDRSFDLLLAVEWDLDDSNKVLRTASIARDIADAIYAWKIDPLRDEARDASAVLAALRDS